MRLRDFAKYIFIGIFLAAFLVAVNFFYQYSYNNQLESYALSQATIQAESDMNYIESKISALRNDYMNNNQNNIMISYLNTVKVNNRPFNDYAICYGSLYEDPTNTVTTSPIKCYIYIYDSMNQRVGRIEFNMFINLLINDGSLDKTFSYWIVNENMRAGTCIASNFSQFNLSGGQGVAFYDYLRRYNDSSVVENFRTELGMNSKATLSLTYSGVDYFVGATCINTSAKVYFMDAISASAFNESMSQLQAFNIMYFIVNIVSIILIVVTTIFTIRKAMKLIDIGRRHGARYGTFIIRVRARDGKIVAYNRGFKSVFSDYKMLKNIDQFTTTSGVPVLEEIKTEDKHIACYFDENSKLGYIEFNSFKERGAYYLIGNNITKEYKQQLDLVELTEKNEITGKSNFNAFFRNYEDIKAESYNKILSFALLELTEFAAISKMLGPENSKQILLSMVNILEDLYPNYKFYQVENDRFLIAYVCASDEELNQMQNRLVERMKHAVVVGNNNLILQYKVATYSYSNERDSRLDASGIMTKLTITLEVAKTMINRQIVKYDSNIESVVRRKNQMETDMKFAVEHGEFMMYYQAQYDVLERRVAGFESLIRWNNPKYLHTSPQEYIELAEKNGYIVPIGKFIIKEVFKQAKMFWEYGVHVSINVSPAQLVQTGFVSDLLEEFDNNHLERGSVCIEITETFLMSNFTVLVEKLNILKDKGFSIHLDDFGTGYSSLLYLKELPVDTIKTDKEFLKNIHQDDAAAAILKEIIHLGKSVNLKIISEGVETMEDYEFLRRAGTDYIQGYLISRPCPLEDAIKLIKEGVNLPTKRKES